MSRKSPKLSYHGSPHHKHEEKIHVKKSENEQNKVAYDNNINININNGVQQEQLIPGLPDDIASLILSKISPSILYKVSNLWRSFIYSSFYPPFYSLYTILTPKDIRSESSSLLECRQYVTPLSFFTFDPISSQWEVLPSPPPLSLLLRHPPFISRDLPVQSVTVGDRLAVVAGTTQHLAPALTRPLVFNPLDQGWGYGPPISVPRRWCGAGALDGSLYVASGVGVQFSTDLARSVERWDLSRCREKWEKLGPLWDGRFSREATDAVGWRGRLCMVNVKGDAAKQGAVYVAEKDAWDEMKEGMVRGWRGPVAAMDEEVMYMVNESKGAVKMYNEEKDHWVKVAESQKLRGAQQMAAHGGKLCVVCKGGSEVVVVDVLASPPKMWVVEPPQGFNIASVHILPRMSRRVHEPLLINAM